MSKLQITSVLTNLMSSGFSIEMYREDHYYVVDVQLDEDNWAKDKIAVNNFSGQELSEILTKLAQTITRRDNDKKASMR